jgi:transposase-like protein
MRTCKYCGSEILVKNGSIKGKQVFKCKNCGHRFVDGSDFPKMRTESRIISTAIDLYYEGLSLRKVQTQIEKIFGVKNSQMTVWKWIMKYSKLVSQFVETLKPQLLGVYHVDETAIKCKGVQKWFWQIIDSHTKFLVASHLSGSRTAEDAIALFEKSIKIAKKKPMTIYCDGLPAYVDGYNKVFRTLRKESRPELIRRIGIRAVRNNNPVERLHGTLKDRTRVTRGLKEMPTVDTMLEGWVIHYNYVRKHQTLKGKTPAQASGISIKNDWHTLVKEATKSNVETEISTRINENENHAKEPMVVVAQ